MNTFYFVTGGMMWIALFVIIIIATKGRNRLLRELDSVQSSSVRSSMLLQHVFITQQHWFNRVRLAGVVVAVVAAGGLFYQVGTNLEINGPLWGWMIGGVGFPLRLIGGTLIHMGKSIPLKKDEVRVVA